MTRILFVCTGNTCRSPMAAALLAKRIEDLPELPDRMEVASAGTRATNGDSATAEAIQVMAARDIDLSSHRARRVDQELLKWADRILTMEPCHRDVCIAQGAAADKVMTIGEFAGTQEKVADPINRGLEVYEQCATQLERLVEHIVERLKRDVTDFHPHQATFGSGRLLTSCQDLVQKPQGLTFSQ